MVFLKRNALMIGLWATFALSFALAYNIPYHTSQVDYVREFILALMSSSVTLIIAAILLRQQTMSEELKDTHSEIFRKKFEVYTDFVRTLIVSLEDKSNGDENLRRLEEDFYKLLLFIDGQETFDKIYGVILGSLRNDNREKIGEVLYCLREELGIQGESEGRLRQPLFWSELGGKMNAFYDAAEKLQNRS